jgi:hypothetical protein
MSTEQFAALQAVTPVVLDLNGDGIQTLLGDQRRAVRPDRHLGETAQVGWASAQDGLLVRDINGDGSINDGTRTVWRRHGAGRAAQRPVTATAPWPRRTAMPTASSAPLTRTSAN